MSQPPRKSNVVPSVPSRGATRRPSQQSASSGFFPQLRSPYLDQTLKGLELGPDTSTAVTGYVRTPTERFEDEWHHNARKGLVEPLADAFSIRQRAHDALVSPLLAGNTEESRRAYAIQKQREQRAERDGQHEMVNHGDPWNNPKLSLPGKLGAGAATLADRVAGSMAANGPLSLVEGGRNALGRIAVQAGVGGASDLIAQRIDTLSGMTDEIDLSRTGGAAAENALQAAGGELAGQAIRHTRNAFRALRDAWEAVGVEVDDIADDELVRATKAYPDPKMKKQIYDQVRQKVNQGS